MMYLRVSVMNGLSGPPVREQIQALGEPGCVEIPSQAQLSHAITTAIRDLLGDQPAGGT